MQTPKTLKKLGEILSKETELGELPSLKEIMEKALKGEPVPIGTYILLNRNCRVEIRAPKEGGGLKPHPRRLICRALVRVLTRCGINGVEVGEGSKIWLESALRAEDMAREARGVIGAGG